MKLFVQQCSIGSKWQRVACTSVRRFRPLRLPSSKNKQAIDVQETARGRIARSSTQVSAHEMVAAFHFLFRLYQQSS